MTSPGASPPQPPPPTANTLHLNPVLLYESMDDCVLDQTSKGLGDVKARGICNSLLQAMGNNAEHANEGFSANSVNHWEDGEYLVVPVTMTSEGVHNGAYKSFNELKKGFNGCENLPITILHPPGRGVIALNEVHGWVRDTWFEPKNAAWKGNAYFIKDEGRLRDMGHDDASVKAHFALCDAIRQGAKFDGSIGYWHGTVPEGGNWNGARYDRKEVNLLPDHLAVIDRGASGWNVGTGFGQNDALPPDAVDVKPDEFIMAIEHNDGSKTETALDANRLDTYDDTWTGKGGPPRAQILHGWLEPAGAPEHRHRFSLIRGRDPTTSEETLLLDVSPVGGVYDEHDNTNPLHRHGWDTSTKTTSDDGHTHDLPPMVDKWLTIIREAENSDPGMKQRKAPPASGVTKLQNPHVPEANAAFLSATTRARFASLFSTPDTDPANPQRIGEPL